MNEWSRYTIKTWNRFADGTVTSMDEDVTLLMPLPEVKSYRHI